MENEKDEAPQQNTTETQGITVLLEKQSINPFRRSRGSGFFIAPDKIATNIHVLTGAGKVSVKCVDTNAVYTIEGIVAFDDTNDIVILKIAENGTPFPLGDSNTVQRGDTVCAIGHSARKTMKEFQLYKLSVSLSFVRKSEKSKSEGTVYAVKKNGKWMEFNLQDAEQGYSGGPVLNSKDEVIAILFQGTIAFGQSVSSVYRLTAISVNRLKDLLTTAEQAEVDTSVHHSTEDVSLKPKTANLLQVESMARWQKRPRIRAYTQLNRGNTKCYKENYKGAIAAYTKALELNPDMTDVYNNRGATKGALGDFEGAIEDFNTAIRLNPEDVSAYDNRGKAKKALGNYNGAIEDFDRVIQLDPEKVEAYYNRGVVKDDLGNYNGAIEDYDMAIQLNPEDADFYYSRAIVKKALGQQEASEADFAKARKLKQD